MSTGGSNSGDVFDVRKVRRLVELMNEHDLAEIYLRQADQRIRIRRGGEPVIVQGSAPAAAPVAAPQPAAAPAPAGDSTGSDASDAGATYITSPMVGTYYTAASPDAAAFCKVGDQVGPDSVVCIIEAMKVFNEIPAECSGTIAAVLVENGDAVEFGQKLYKLTPNS